jgi:hypothetical protein
MSNSKRLAVHTTHKLPVLLAFAFLACGLVLVSLQQQQQASRNTPSRQLSACAVEPHVHAAVVALPTAAPQTPCLTSNAAVNSSLGKR